MYEQNIRLDFDNFQKQKFEMFISVWTKNNDIVKDLLMDLSKSSQIFCSYICTKYQNLARYCVHTYFDFDHLQKNKVCNVHAYEQKFKDIVK